MTIALLTTADADAAEMLRVGKVEGRVIQHRIRGVGRSVGMDFGSVVETERVSMDYMYQQIFVPV